MISIGVDTGLSNAIMFTVPGPPVPKERPRVGARGGRTPERTAAYEKHVGVCALCARQAFRAKWPMDAKAYGIEIQVFELPKSRGDIDNYMKSIADGLHGVLYGTDRRLKKATLSVEVDREKPRAEVKLWVLE